MTFAVLSLETREERVAEGITEQGTDVRGHRAMLASVDECLQRFSVGDARLSDVTLDDPRSTVFGEVAVQYDRSRPSYPDAMVDDLIGDTTPRVVDVGCGTGIAARLFLARGCDVLGVGPDARMAEVAQRSGIRVVMTRFEEWQTTEQFDLLTSGQAWHWIDAEQGPVKAAEVLRVGGRLAAFWNYY